MKKTITAENQFTDPMQVKTGHGFSISIRGSLDATVVLQRVLQRDEPAGDSDWSTVETYTTNKEENALDYGGHWYRIGVPTGSYTSGEGTVELAW